MKKPKDTPEGDPNRPDADAPQPKIPSSSIPGEGDHDAARRHRNDAGGYVAEEGEDGVDEAAEALDGPERERLRQAEGKAPARR